MTGILRKERVNAQVPWIVRAMNAWTSFDRRGRLAEVRHADKNVSLRARLATTVRRTKHQPYSIAVEQYGGAAARERALAGGNRIRPSGSRVEHAHAIVVHEAHTRGHHAGAEADGVRHAHCGALVVVCRHVRGAG